MGNIYKYMDMRKSKLNHVHFGTFVLWSGLTFLDSKLSQAGWLGNLRWQLSKTCLTGNWQKINLTKDQVFWSLPNCFLDVICLPTSWHLTMQYADSELKISYESVPICGFLGLHYNTICQVVRTFTTLNRVNL